MLRLKVKPEVSSLDFTNGVTLSGFRIPALTTRRAETVVELRDGQSFAIAGLLDNIAQTNGAEIPVHVASCRSSGRCSRAVRRRADQTELMVLVTPRLVRALDPDEVPPLPTDPGMFLKKPGEEEMKPPEPKKPGGGDDKKTGGDIGDQLAGPAGFVDAPAPMPAKKKAGLERETGDEGSTRG